MPGEWHNRMEGYFPEDMREVKFFCSSRHTENTCRLADVLLNDKRTCEIQHSYISSYDIQQRFKHWNKFGKDIIWIVDGNTDDITLEKLTKGTYLIEFTKCWKYKSFRDIYDYILLDIDNDIYKIPLREVKCRMVEVKEYKSLASVIDKLKDDPENIWDMWEDSNNIATTLTVHQKGAGNGKTYGIWESICTNNDKETYIIVTKQHTAKEVIYQELEDQTARCVDHVLENITDKQPVHTHKQYVLKYTHIPSDKRCIVIIGTIDSFCWGLTACENTTGDFFESLVNSISDKGCGKLQGGSMRYASQGITLNKRSELWIDETQDLPTTYLKAMLKLMLETGIDVNVVGDKLQSLGHVDNFMTALSEEGLPGIHVKNIPASNTNRRIKVKGMHSVINQLVEFGELPKISIPNEHLLIDNGESIVTLDSPSIYAGDKDITKVNNYIDTILSKVNDEVDTHVYRPEDFLFIFPIMKGNTLAEELHGKLQTYWVTKFKDETYAQNISEKDSYWATYDHSTYTQYAILHKHQEGQVINTKDSEKSSRIMTIQSSKGDGRDVVFVLGCTEQSLKLVSNGERNLLYESHLHVALTRAKSKIYFGLTENNDNIHKKFGSLGIVGYIPSLKKNLQPNDLLMNSDKQVLIDLLKRNVDSLDDAEFSQVGETVDWKYHCIKMQLYLQYFIFSLLGRKEFEVASSSQIITVIRSIQRLQVTGIHIKEFDPFLRDLGRMEQLPWFPLCHMKHSVKYDKKYYHIIKKTMNKIRSIDITELHTLTPYESVVLSYMIHLFQMKGYYNMGPKDIYDITDFFESDYITKEQTLLTHTQVIKALTDNVIQSIYDTYKGVIRWNINHLIQYGGTNEEFTIHNNYPLVGYSDNHVYHFMLKSDYNSLNYWDTLMEVLIERFIIAIPKSNDRDENNHTRYNDKPIITYLMVLNTNSYETFDWSWESTISDKLKQEITSAIIKYYTPFHKEYYTYLRYVDNNTDDTRNGSPYDYVIRNIIKTAPQYIVDYFKDLEDDYEPGDTIVQESTFMKKLDKKLTKRSKSYIG